MASGQKPWRDAEDSDYGIWALMFRIGFNDEMSEIPREMSEEGKDFLRCCFEKEPSNRWTAEMLLSHPFVPSSSGLKSGEVCFVLYTTPRSVLGYSFDISTILSSSPRTLELVDSFLFWYVGEGGRERIRALASEEKEVRKENPIGTHEGEVFLQDEFRCL